jgi:hypothetical protein
VIEPAVLVEDFEVIPALALIELDRDALVSVARFAEYNRALCTANDVRGFDQMTVYDKVARGLRDTFCGPRWQRDDTDNQAGIRNPHLKIRVIPCNFDRHAGNPKITPTNRREKGEASDAKTRCNRTGWLPGLPMPQPPGDEWRTWLFAINTEESKPLGAELSFPLSFINGHYSLFNPRIILLSPSHEGGGGAGIGESREGPTEIIDIAIRRR